METFDMFARPVLLFMMVGVASCTLILGGVPKLRANAVRFLAMKLLAYADGIDHRIRQQESWRSRITSYTAAPKIVQMPGPREIEEADQA